MYESRRSVGDEGLRPGSGVAGGCAVHGATNTNVESERQQCEKGHEERSQVSVFFVGLGGGWVISVDWR